MMKKWKSRVDELKYMFFNAKSFFKLADLGRKYACDQKLPNIEKAGYVFSHIVNYAFACELYIKLFLKWFDECNKLSNSHKLSSLLSSCPDKLQNEIYDKVQYMYKRRNTALCKCEFWKKMKSINNVYKKCRYFYDNDLTQGVDCEFLTFFSYVLDNMASSLIEHLK